LPTSVQRQITPAINNTQINSCLTVEFNRISSFSGLHHPDGAAAPASRSKNTATPSPKILLHNQILDAQTYRNGSTTSKATGSRVGHGRTPEIRFYSDPAKIGIKPATN
jgi:hypothetical protein